MSEQLELNSPEKLYKIHSELCKIIAVKDWLLEDVNSSRMEILNLRSRWQRHNDDSARRQADIIADNITRDYEQRDEAKHKYTDNLNEAARYFDPSNQEAFFDEVIAKARAEGVDLNIA
jgi:hypothetical protein